MSALTMLVLVLWKGLCNVQLGYLGCVFLLQLLALIAVVCRNFKAVGRALINTQTLHASGS